MARRAYLSCVKDGCTKEILAHYISASLEMDIVYKTLEKLKKISVKFNFIQMPFYIRIKGFIILVHYFKRKVQKLGITQSMSRRGNCWDNAPMESFFGHFKDEVSYKECNSLKELKSM